MVKALGVVIGILITVTGFEWLLISNYLTLLGFPTYPILILGLLLTLIGFMFVIIAIIVYLCYGSPILIIPQG